MKKWRKFKVIFHSGERKTNTETSTENAEEGACRCENVDWETKGFIDKCDKYSQEKRERSPGVLTLRRTVEGTGLPTATVMEDVKEE